MRVTAVIKLRLNHSGKAVCHFKACVATSSDLTVRRFPNNARRDSLDKYWRELYGASHALVVLAGFLENVSLHKVEGRELAADEQERNVTLKFNPHAGGEMLVPCVWSHWDGSGEPSLDSFAIITDDPPAEIAATGHDRCPINLTPEAAFAWLNPGGRSRAELSMILNERQRPVYAYARAVAA
jgi:putative SOS response-associated peptidase YedK